MVWSLLAACAAGQTPEPLDGDPWRALPPLAAARPERAFGHDDHGLLILQLSEKRPEGLDAKHVSWDLLRFHADDGTLSVASTFGARPGAAFLSFDKATRRILALISDGREFDILHQDDAVWKRTTGRWPSAGEVAALFTRSNSVVAVVRGDSIPASLVVIDPLSGASEILATLPILDPRASRFAATQEALFFLQDRALWRFDFHGERAEILHTVPEGVPLRQFDLAVAGAQLFVLVRDPRDRGRDPSLLALMEAPRSLPTLHPAFPPPEMEGKLTMVPGTTGFVLVQDQFYSGPVSLWRYDAVLGEKERHRNWRADVRLEWAIEALRDDRATETWVEETLTGCRPSHVIGHLGRHQDGPMLLLRWRLLQAQRQRRGVDLGAVFTAPFSEVLGVARSLWPLELDRLAKDGSYEWIVLARSLAGQVAHDTLILAVDARAKPSETLCFLQTERERLFVFALEKPFLKTYSGGALFRGRMDYAREGGGTLCPDLRGLVLSLPKDLELPVPRPFPIPNFIENSGRLPREVEELIPPPYRVPFSRTP